MNLEEAAEQALKHLESVSDWDTTYPIGKAKEALRQALAQKKTEWVGLTDEETYDVLEGATGDGGRVYYDTLFQSYEAKLKEKNSCG